LFGVVAEALSRTSVISGHADKCAMSALAALDEYFDGATNVRFSNRPVGVKHFQTIHHCSVDIARGLVLLFGIGTKALPLWDSRTRWNNLWGGLAV